MSQPASNPVKPTKPELLAPAGDWDCARAAVENGADAIYFGLQCGFNARARAANFPLEDLTRLMQFLHQRGVKGYVTLNTLAFPSELPEVESIVRACAAAGVDALLVQDIGVARLARATCPDLPLHASTQMTITSAECLAAAEALGIERAVLARELSIREVAKIHAQAQTPVEVFVHGALCVAYSGQCLTSESLGGRSANRGQCAQACRLPYQLVVDGADRDLGPQKYLLSPQDLAAYALVPELIAAGVCSFKIEGRLKTPEYVANITRHYRRAIDAAVQGSRAEFTQRDVEEMELSFSRGFSPGWLEGCEHKRLVPGLSSSKRGVFLGTVRGLKSGRVCVELASPVRPGDGVVFDGDRAAGDEQGGRVYEVLRTGPGGQPRSANAEGASGLVELGFQRAALDLGRIRVGQKLWKTDDPQLTARLRKTFTGPEALRRVPLDLDVEAGVGRPLRVRARAANGAACEVATPEPLAAAHKHPLGEDLLRAQLGRLGQTVYELRALSAKIDGQPMAPLSVLGKLRRTLVAGLEASLQPPPRQIAGASALAALRSVLPPRAAEAARKQPSELHVLCRSLAQLAALLAAGERRLYADFADITQYRQAVTMARQANARLLLATPRIHKPDELGIFRALLKQEPDGILVRNLAGLAFYTARQVAVVADFSLNATNELSAQWLLERGAERITASYDLNREQLFDLVDALPPTWLEVVVHQHMPLFHMEHCVFCSVLSPGTNKTNCGRPCDVHQVKLRDHIGMEHPLTADVGCRNTLFNAVPQSGAEAVPQLLARGVRHFRLELLDDAPADIARTLGLYRRLLAGEVSGRDVWTELRAANRVGVTRGTLEERRNPLAIV